MATDRAGRKGSSRTRLIIGVAILAILLVVSIVFDFGGALRGALETIRDMSVITGALVFMVLYTVTTVFLVPGSILTLAAGDDLRLSWLHRRRHGGLLRGSLLCPGLGQLQDRRTSTILGNR
jgi:hypothetical protein